MLGRSFSHYRVLSELGRGGMGVVYLAEDTLLGRRVAIKFPTRRGDSQKHRRRILAEARAASALTHPHIAAVYDCGEHEGQPYIVMELVPGESLHQLLRKGRLPVERSVEIIQQVAEALEEAHQQKIAHRDIKPSNIRISTRGDVKVLDFGLAKQLREESEPGTGDDALASTATLEGTIRGSPGYMAPEQARGEAGDERSDLFALGVVLYECLAGRRAFHGASLIDILAQSIHVDPPPPSQLNQEVSPELDRITLKALAKDPRARYQSAAEVLVDLSAAATAWTPTATAPVLAPSQSPGWRVGALAGFLRNRRSAVLLLGFSAAAVVGVWRLWLVPSPPAPEAQRWYEEGIRAMHDGTYVKASLALEKAVSVERRFPLARARLAEAWMELDYGDKAREQMLEVLAPGVRLRRLSGAETLYVEAIHRTLTADFAGAVDKYREIAGQAPESEKPGAYLDLGRAYEKAQKPREALASYAESARRSPQYAAAFLRMGVLYGRQRDLPRASEAFRQAESLYRTLANQEGVAEVLYQEGSLANRLGKIEEAVAFLNQALEMAMAAKHPHQQIGVLMQLSQVSFTRGDTARARELANDALELARASGLENLTTRGLITLGNAFWVAGDAEEGKKYFHQALEFARRHKARLTEARALLSLASLRIDQRETDQGLRDAEAAIAFFEEAGYQKEAAQASLLVARAKRDQGDYEAAQKIFEQQLEIARAAGDQSMLALAQEGLATLLLRQERFPEALTYLAERYTASKSRGDNLGAAYGLALRSGALAALGRYQEARESLTEAAGLAAGPAGSETLARSVDQRNAEIALSQRRFAEAREISRRLLSTTKREAARIEAKLVFGLAQGLAGSKREGRLACEEALDLALKASDPVGIAKARLALAEILLESGEAPEALEPASAAHSQFAAGGQGESQWRAELLMARAAKGTNQPSKAREFASSAMSTLSGLEQKWGAQNYQSYLSRPDVKQYRLQLMRLYEEGRGKR